MGSFGFFPFMGFNFQWGGGNNNNTNNTQQNNQNVHGPFGPFGMGSRMFNNLPDHLKATVTQLIILIVMLYLFIITS